MKDSTMELFQNRTESVFNSRLTAITRSNLPLPVRWLLNNNLIKGDVLDYGCGKCRYVNEKYLRGSKIKSVTNYDPNYELMPIDAPTGFDTILCTYVLNVLDEKHEIGILDDIQQRLNKYGVAFISVRNDEPKNEWGFSSIGTFQRQVVLPYLFLLRSISAYRIYVMTENMRLPN